MTDRQSNKQNMATTTKGVLDTNLSLFETIVAFFTQYGLLGNSLTTINTLSTLQGTDITGYAVAKENLKKLRREAPGVTATTQLATTTHKRSPRTIKPWTDARHSNRDAMTASV